MKNKEAVLIRVYRDQHTILKEYAERNFMSLIGAVSRLIEQHLKE